MVSALISRIIMLLFGTLYPAYRSYKAIKNKDVREYVKWMMYWIIFALFITVESFADIFISWLPLYYEIKIVFIIWLLSPATKGSSILYRKFVHPRLVQHEQAIDKYIAKAQKRSYSALMDAGKKGLNVATDTLMKTAVTGQHQLIQTLKRYNSMQELRLSDRDDVDTTDFDKRATWYQGMNTSEERNFDPEVDINLLQQQYKPSIPESLEEDSISSQGLRNDRSNLDRTGLDGDSNYQYTRSTSTSIDYNYSYSNTLPRARKQRKPIQEGYYYMGGSMDDGDTYLGSRRRYHLRSSIDH